MNCHVYPWADGAAVNSTDVTCAGEPACQFANCILNMVMPGLPTHSDLDEDGNNVSPDPTWCSDYGEVQGTFVDEGRYSYYDVTAITGCLDKLLYVCERNGQGDACLKDPIVNDQVLENLMEDIYDEVLGNPIRNIDGCLNSDIPADCHEDTTGAFWLSTYGTPCTGLDCYQMCSTIAELDAEANNSWVRTDIWWRNERDGDRVINPPWVSWYYAGSQYVHNSNIVFGGVKNITGYENDFYPIPDGYFGAALDEANSGIVVNEAPLGVTPSAGLSTVTFFSTDAGQSRDLAHLFARVYKRLWNGLAYDPGSTEMIDALANDQNPHAGFEYNPRILQVCEDKICKDGAGTVQSGITVNNRTTGQVDGHSSLFTAIKFFYYAHPDHMPIVNVDIDWDDDNAGFVTNPGKYKNSIPTCGADLLTPGGEGLQGFGGLDRACRQGYKVFYHDYRYDPDYLCDGSGGSPDLRPVAASCYKPGVQLKDRWSNTSIEYFDNWIVIYEQ